VTILGWTLFSAFVAAAVIAAMLRLGRAGPLDRPNERSLHATPVPRSGGIGVMAGVAVGMVAGQPAPAIVGALALLALVSWLDDRRSLPVLVRFASHFIAAGLAIATLPDWGWLGVMAALLFIVWMINLYNFMDGANGLAGGMAVFGFGAYAVAAMIADKAPLAVLAACVAAAAMGFLLFNFDPARIFMGDVGSIPLGFLAAALGVDGIRVEAWPLWFPVLAFSPFIVDASVTLLRRALRGEKVWQAHREHYYQRLVRAGWTHRRLALHEYALMAGVAASGVAMIAAPTPVQAAGLAAWGAVFAFLMFAVDRRAPAP
jgi:UDP-N-acetylmuramyl pentapeptide phosphotransferase/UDP-N-acetylglucosamine-1-phosphate transferase